jgi:nitroreductase
MTVTEAVRQRRSIRAFLPTPVTETTLREVLDTARWAPSGSNVQAWKIVAVAGVERDAVVRMALESMGTPSLANHDEFPVYPPNLWEPLRTRRFALAEDMYRALGIPREDKPARLRHVARNFALFDAPVGLFFILDRRVAHGQWAHLGMLIQTVALLLEERGLSSRRASSCRPKRWSIAAWQSGIRTWRSPSMISRAIASRSTNSRNSGGSSPRGRKTPARASRDPRPVGR